MTRSVPSLVLRQFNWKRISIDWVTRRQFIVSFPLLFELTSGLALRTEVPVLPVVILSNQCSLLSIKWEMMPFWFFFPFRRVYTRFRNLFDIEISSKLQDRSEKVRILGSLSLSLCAHLLFLHVKVQNSGYNSNCQRRRWAESGRNNFESHQSRTRTIPTGKYKGNSFFL